MTGCLSPLPATGHLRGSWQPIPSPVGSSSWRVWEPKACLCTSSGTTIPQKSNCLDYLWQDLVYHLHFILFFCLWMNYCECWILHDRSYSSTSRTLWRAMAFHKPGFYTRQMLGALWGRAWAGASKVKVKLKLLFQPPWRKARKKRTQQVQKLYFSFYWFKLFLKRSLFCVGEMDRRVSPHSPWAITMEFIR